MPTPRLVIPALLTAIWFPADCCDGSDEVSGCKNTCLEKNAAVREGLKQKLADYKKALKTKHVVLDSADAKRHHIQERLQNIPADITAAQQRVAQLAGVCLGEMRQAVICVCVHAPGVAWLINSWCCRLLLSELRCKALAHMLLAPCLQLRRRLQMRPTNRLRRRRTTRSSSRRLHRARMQIPLRAMPLKRSSRSMRAAQLAQMPQKR
jgi:hypothetical protein